MGPYGSKAAMDCKRLNGPSMNSMELRVYDVLAGVTQPVPNTATGLTEEYSKLHII